jgi:hypothetical protein
MVVKSSQTVLCGEKTGALLLPKESLRSSVVVDGDIMASGSSGMSKSSKNKEEGFRSIESWEDGRCKSRDCAKAMVLVLAVRYPVCASW